MQAAGNRSLAGARSRELVRAYHGIERLREAERPHRSYKDVLVSALVEAADQVVDGRATLSVQDEDAATYEGIVGQAESRVNWANHVDITYNLLRGCDPSPGAWTTHNGARLFLHDCRKQTARTYGETKGRKIGQVVAIGDGAVTIHGQGGFIVARRLRPEGGQKVAADQAGLTVGTILGL